MKETDDNVQRTMSSVAQCQYWQAVISYTNARTQTSTKTHKKTLKSLKLFWWCHSSAKFMSNNNLFVDKIQTRSRTTERRRIVLFRECQSERAREKKRTDEYFCAGEMTKQISHLSFAMSLWHWPSKKCFSWGKNSVLTFRTLKRDVILGVNGTKCWD